MGVVMYFGIVKIDIFFMLKRFVSSFIMN
jgi:hypothetical protein